jgi:SOS-response transcriptional repressor LexA
MRTEAERYTYIQARSGLNKKDFAQSLDLAKEQGSMLGRGRQKATREVLAKLAYRYGVDLTWYITGEGDPENGPGTVSIALFDQEAAAGRGIEIDEYQERRLISVPSELIAPWNPAKVRAVNVSGDSMTGAGINDKDIILFRICQPEGNGIYVVSIGTTLLVKRVDFNDIDKTVVLISENPAYAPREISGDDLESLRIEGRVIACLHRF